VIYPKAAIGDGPLRVNPVHWREIAVIDLVGWVDQRNVIKVRSMNSNILKGAAAARIPLLAIVLAIANACTLERGFMDSNKLNDFATQYTAAWCSQKASSVASFFGEQGSLKINDGAPCVGRDAITKAAQGFMTAFPDLVVKMDSVEKSGTDVTYRWTLTGTNTGPGGTGKSVRISGYEQWRFGPDGLIAESRGHFDAADYQRQLTAGAKNP
jgi:predicted ester cyclase